MKQKIVLFALITLSIWSCDFTDKSEPLRDLVGPWTLQKMTFPAGYERHYPQDNQHVCLIIGSDSTFYNCRFHYTESGVAVLAGEMSKLGITAVSDSEYQLSDNGNTRPLMVINDSTIMTQHHGVQYTWLKDRTLSPRCVKEICDIVTEVSINPGTGLMQYVVSTGERELQSINYRLACLILLLSVVLLSVAIYAYRTLQRKKHIERRLEQISEEQAFRPNRVAQAMQDVMDDFFASDYYRDLKHKVTQGAMLKPQDWRDMEDRLRAVSPDFIRHLSALCHMSVTEWRVCLLIKLRFTPTEIAGTLAKEPSSISSIRSRLYKKIFDKPGSSKDWDAFIMSL